MLYSFLEDKTDILESHIPDSAMNNIFIKYKKKFKNPGKVFYVAGAADNNKLIFLDPLGDEREYKKYFRTLNNINKHFQRIWRKKP